MSDSIETCPIWGGSFEASGYIDQATRTWVVENSPRAGGGFEIGQIAHNTVSELDELQKAVLTSMLVNQRLLGVSRPWVTPKIVEDAKRMNPLSIPERAIRLLRYFAENSKDIGQQFTMGKGDPVDWGALAWSESEIWPRAFKLAEYLKSKGWIELVDWGDTATIEVMVDGFSRIEEEVTKVDSSQAFVAMWFDCETDVAYESRPIKPAIEEAGYKPVRIDRELPRVPSSLA